MENEVKTPSRRESRIIKLMILLGMVSIVNFLFFFFQPEHRINSTLFVLLSIVIVYGALKKLYMWYNYSNISVPKAPKSDPDLKVDILTTYFPGEPYAMVTTTLKAIQNIHYPHQSFLCDEANDPFLKEFCQEHGIHHVTRETRKDAKAGNINNALEKVATGDICVVLDPDHIPQPNFLDPILPHFTDPKIGFVQIVQSYYNIEESLVARGAAEQTFQFYGPMMMTLNSFGAVNAIGANCVFRRSALDDIGGHASGLCEDMHTAMLLYSKGWKAVYVPEVLAKGLAPANLTNFFKQQLKWARGSFDLWLKVYPRIFNKLTVRQKIHFGILPMHYLSGVIILITFLIPILSLVFSTTPWKGNIVDFALVLLPVAASAVLIRTFIQKWVIEKKERGFHVVGGLLHINTWWIYIIGFVYTLIGKKVPYLPTPKEGAFETQMKIILPNAIVAVVSLASIGYGLHQDLTPFSIVMAAFAFFNASIMAFGIYIAMKVPNENRILRNLLRKEHKSILGEARKNFYKVANGAFTATRKVALPLLLLILIAAMSFKHQNDRSKWEEVYPPLSKKVSHEYLGIFHPSNGQGLSDMNEINALEQQQNIKFDIVSLYLAWTDQSIKKFPHELIRSIYQNGSLPMITWEPWGSTLTANQDIPELQEEQQVFQYIIDGRFDRYIRKFAQILKSYDRPIFLRFAHEFDNPQYPWSAAGGNNPEEFKRAWKHVFDLIHEEGARKVMLVWNPWKADAMKKYYPGDQYVDWVGLTILDYSPISGIAKHSFNELYAPYEAEMSDLTRKPIMLAEFGSLKKGREKKAWLASAMDAIKEDHQEISAVVYFNSGVDKNLPAGTSPKQNILDWKIDSWKSLDTTFGSAPARQIRLSAMDNERADKKVLPPNMKGVRYKKGTNWKNNYYVVTKEVLTEDFGKIKRAGMNTIQITGGNIYDHNLLRYSEQAGLQLIYQFYVDKSIDFIEDQRLLNELTEDILERVRDLKDENQVVGYSFDMNLHDQYRKPLLFAQQTAFLRWLQDLTTRIKRIDVQTPLILDLPLEAGTPHQIAQIESHLNLDAYGLIVQDTSYLQKTLSSSKLKDLPVFISSVDPGLILEHPVLFSGQDIILQNWQDQRQSDWMSFDGLIDFRGRQKKVLQQITNLWSPDQPKAWEFRSRILKPAEPLYPGQIYTYNAVIRSGKDWKLASFFEKDAYTFEWNLIKEDSFGNPLALKKIGRGPHIELLIPEQYKNYSLMLITRKKGSKYVHPTRSALHTAAEDQ